MASLFFHERLCECHTQITIYDVYYSLSFNVNLLSVSKLTNFSNYMLSFTKSCAFIFDKVTRKIVGQVDMLKGLYYLKHTMKGPYNYFASVVTSSTWH